jgi:cytochrome c553
MKVAKILLLSIAGSVSAVANTQQEGERLFSLKVRQVLSSKCFACHGEESKKVKGEFDLTTREGLLKGGESE